MKLSKRNAARQRALQNAIASGKTLGFGCRQMLKVIRNTMTGAQQPERKSRKMQDCLRTDNLVHSFPLPNEQRLLP